MSERETHAREDRTIQDLCHLLTLLGRRPVVRLCRPDRWRDGACDAILWGQEGVVAVEHTTIHQVARKPGEVKKLAAITPTIRDALTAAYPSARIHVLVELAMLSAPWRRVAQKIAEACLERLKGDDGSQRLQLHADGMEIRVSLDWSPDWEYGGFCVVHPAVWDQEPRDLTIEDIRRAIRSKGEKMLSYREQGARTMLLLEGGEPWASRLLLGIARAAAEQEDCGVFDDIMLATRLFDSAHILPLKLDGRFPADQAGMGAFEDMQREERLGDYSGRHDPAPRAL